MKSQTWSQGLLISQKPYRIWALDSAELSPPHRPSSHDCGLDGFQHSYLLQSKSTSSLLQSINILVKQYMYNTSTSFIIPTNLVYSLYFQFLLGLSYIRTLFVCLFNMQCFLRQKLIKWLRKKVPLLILISDYLLSFRKGRYLFQIM